jgi:hypothetical protein
LHVEAKFDLHYIDEAMPATPCREASYPVAFLKARALAIGCIRRVCTNPRMDSAQDRYRRSLCKCRESALANSLYRRTFRPGFIDTRQRKVRILLRRSAEIVNRIRSADDAFP